MKKLNLLILALLSCIALAQSTNAPGIPASWVAIALGIIGSALAFGLVKLNTLATAKIGTVKNEGFQKVLATVWALASAKVAQLLQTTVNEIKESSEDGKLTLEEARAALGIAVSEIWQALPAEQQKQLGDAAALPEDKTPEQKAARAKELIIVPNVEAAVSEQKTPSIVFKTQSIEPGTVSEELERMERGNRATAARKALQERLAKTRASINPLPQF